MTYTNTYAGADGVVLLAKDADDQFDLIETEFAARPLNAAPGPIGSGTPSTGAFTTLSASGTVSGAGITARFSAAGPIGDGTPSTGAFTTLSASGAVSGAGFTSRFAAPGPIGSVTPSTGSFTTVLATSALDFQGASASGLLLNVVNETAGAVSYCGVALANDDNDQTQFRQTSSTFTPIGVFGARTGGLAGSAVAIGASGTFEIGVGALYPLTFQFAATLNRSYVPMNYRGGDNASATNSAFGEGALDSNSGGTGNTAVGNNALTANTTGEFCTAVGYGALATTSTVASSSAFGYEAANASVGTENTSVGFRSMYSTTSGFNNTAVGANALGSNITGSNNVAVGNTAGPTASNLDNTISLGTGAEATASNQVALGNGSITEVTTAGKLQILSGTAVPAGGTAGAGLRFSSTANLGVFFGSGVPTLAAAQGSLYMRTDGSSTSTRMYVNTDGGTTWTAVTTAA